MSVKNKFRFLFLALLFAVIFSNCESTMGMGPYVDLEPATIKITGIVLPDGTEIALLENDNKLLAGPGILVGPGFYLKGTAWDNEKVIEITVEETGSGAEIVDGKPRVWKNAVIIPKRNVSGANGIEYDWTISLDGISPGERNILVNVYDFPRNIGPNSVKQLTLLVDIDPPFIEKINIERQAGITVGLLPRTKLEEMDTISFENIDYFQNEYFTIRASISHKFSLSGVTLNLTDENGKKLFENGLERTAGTTVYAPSWFITAEQLIDADPKLASGRHYLKVSITARAEAGHSGQNEDKTNILYNLCWYPEADIPNMQMTVQASGKNGEFLFEKGNKMPIRVYDDDNVGEVYASLVTVETWNGYMPSSGEDVKLQSLITNLGNPQFPELTDNRLPTPARNTVIEVDAGETRGDYRLIILVKDINDSGKTGVWGWKLFNISIVEEGIPIIAVDSPTANTAPLLVDGKYFTITGNVQNLDDLDKVKIAWVPAGAAENPDWDANKQGQQALLSENTGVMGNGIKIWEIDLFSGINISNKYKKQTFSLKVDIFADFLYNGKIENESKLFVLYVKGKGGDDVFENFNVLPYSKPPTLDITPVSYHEVAPNSTLNFNITALSPNGVQIDDDKVTLYSKSDNSFITLSRNGDLWMGTQTSKSVKASYDYEITAEDKLGFKTQQIVTIVVTAAPELLRITSPHNSGVVFSSRDTITIQAVFDNPVTTVTGVPRLVLGGFTPSSTMRYATYSGGADTTTLNFSYKVQEKDYTGVPGALTGLTVTGFELNGGNISAITPDIGALAPVNNLPATKRLNVDGRAPKITDIAISGKADGAWHREGEDLTFKVIVDREIRVLGTPKLRLLFGTKEKNADFQTVENGNKTMVFQYKVKANDEAVPVKIYSGGTGCFTTGDSQMITDTAGSNGNYLSLTGIPASTGTVNVDAVAPAALNVSYTVNNAVSKTIQIATGNIEQYATVEYTLNNGASWTALTSPYTIGPLTAVNSYSVRARQTDRAGNVSPDGSKLEFTISDCSLIAVSCDNPNGAYPAGSSLTFKLIFSGKVYNTSGTSITLSGTINGSAGTQVITFPSITQANAASTLTATWNNIPEGVIMNPVTISAINLGGVRGNDNNATPNYQDSVRTDYNTSRTGLKVLSVRPTITAINTKTITANDIVLDSANTTVTLTFSQPVWPEKGVITVKPASGWLIPPVLSNEDFAKINNALNSTDQTALTDGGKASYYIKNTHGLLKNGSNQFTGAPDTDTKYVLNFSSGLDNAVLRPIMERAKYLWQEVESVSASQVTGAGGTNITLTLDKLPNGRKWKIEIEVGAFRDEAGNTFAGWGASPAYTFWSAKTADPVIRVNRISNNSATTAPSTNTVSGTMGTSNEITSRINVQYRIDCETPGAAISYGTSYGTPTSSVSAVSSATTGFGPSSTDGTQNSSNADATAAQLGNITANTAYSIIGTNYLTIGDTDLYTARKDYIAATAVRSGTPALATSDRSYEGAFKTVIVYRNPPAGGGTLGTDRFVKLEATNTQNGAVTISGFPMNYNDTSGKSSKYAYQNSSATCDWIWISWEIVSNFWHVGMIVNSSTPNSTLPADPWAPFNGDWYAHNFRKYGNWGLRIGN